MRAAEASREAQGEQAQRRPFADDVAIVAVERPGEAGGVLRVPYCFDRDAPQSREHSQRIVRPSAQKR